VAAALPSIPTVVLETPCHWGKKIKLNFILFQCLGGCSTTVGSDGSGGDPLPLRKLFYFIFIYFLCFIFFYFFIFNI
jgi:hypothetical protein